MRTARILIAIDGHTHIYSSAHAKNALFAGGETLRQITAPGAAIVCFLCDPAGSDTFGSLRDAAEANFKPEDRSGCAISTTMESASLSIGEVGEAGVIVVRGQQLVSSEKLEILVIGHATTLTSGRPLYKTLDAARVAGAHIIVPWGAGKWTGARGRLVSEMLQGETFPGLHLGDNGGRPAIWPVTQFRDAAARGMKVVSGSDPLPIARDEKRIGTYGSTIDRELDTVTPWKSISGFLADPDVSIKTVGSSLSFPRFLRQQTLLRFRAMH